MGNYEDRVRKQIIFYYGSIPKMSKATGIPTTTIYHALERGLDNTTTRTRHQILEALYFSNNDAHTENDALLSDDENELICLYRKMNDSHRKILLETARSFAVTNKKKK